MNELIEASSNERRSLPWIAAAGLSALGLVAAKTIASRVRRTPVRLRGKVAIVTGGSRGLGLAIATELANKGVRLALVARDRAELEAAADRLRGPRTEVEVFPADVTQASAIPSLVSRIAERFGSIDILVNDAGAIKVSALENLEHSDFEEAMNLMFWAPVNLTFAVLPYMRRQGSGHIVNITSIGGRVAVPHLLPYSCAKFAFVGFSTGLANELDPEKVNVLTVVPGLMRTGSYLNAMFKGAAQNEFAWFSLLGNLPGFSVAAEDAAREICEAIVRRQATCTISFPAKLLVQSEALMPETTRSLLRVMNQFLPGAGSAPALPGKALNNRFSTLFQTLTSLGKTAAAHYNQ